MINLPKPILGDVTALTITTPDLNTSLQFYKKLGFAEVMRADWPFPWVQISDGVLLIMLRQDEKPYLALTYYVRNIETVAKELTENGIKFTQKPKKADQLKRYIFQSPDGLTISLVSMADGFAQPPGPGMLQMDQQDYFNPGKYVNKTCGLFGELAHPVADLEKSLEFWKLLGFTSVSIHTAPYPWAIISDGLSIVGLHQSAHFSHPTITYFAADMPQKIAALKKNGLKDINGQGSLTTPEQQHIFLFSLGGGDQKKEKKKTIEQFTLKTKRLLLKEVNQQVLDELYTTRTDEEAMVFLGLNTMADLLMEKNKWEKGYTNYRTSFKFFLMEELSSGRIIGSVSLHHWFPMHRRSELGYAIHDEAAKRKGYTSEAVQAVVKHGFEDLDLNRIEAFASPGNIASVKILKGAGFIQEGLLREHYFKNGIMEDSACFAILRSEYFAADKQ